MSLRPGLGCMLLLTALLAQPGTPKVYVRWTQRVLPPAKTLGVDELVIPWSDAAQGLIAEAKKQGYRVFVEVKFQDAQAAADASAKAGIAGIILTGEAKEQNQVQQAAQKLRAANPKVKILILDAGGKQPDMRGWLVFKKDGILQVSSPTSQPWLDANLTLVLHERAYQSDQRPLYTFSWDVSDPLVKEQGPKPEDYSLAIAEAGAYHADLILEMYEKQQKGLAEGDKQALADWKQVKRYIDFYERANPGAAEPQARVGVLTEDYDLPYEPMNLMARHNIPFRVRRSSEVKAHDLDKLDVVIAFAALSKEQVDAINDFATRGGVAVLVNLPGAYPWESSTPEKKGEHVAKYTVGKGRVIELGEALTDPETFAQDVRRLMAKEQIPVSLWNSLTTLTVSYDGEKASETTVELVNYAEEATQVQVQVRGKFASVHLETPERGCCETLKASHVDGMTEFVVPDVVIGARVHLTGTASRSTSQATSAH
jgi:hypothetical protein